MTEKLPLKRRDGTDYDNYELDGGKHPTTEAELAVRQEIERIWQKHIGGNAGLVASLKEWEFLMELYASGRDKQ